MTPDPRPDLRSVFEGTMAKLQGVRLYIPELEPPPGQRRQSPPALLASPPAPVEPRATSRARVLPFAAAAAVLLALAAFPPRPKLPPAETPVRTEPESAPVRAPLPPTPPAAKALAIKAPVVRAPTAEPPAAMPAAPEPAVVADPAPPKGEASAEAAPPAPPEEQAPAAPRETKAGAGAQTVLITKNDLEVVPMAEAAGGRSEDKGLFAVRLRGDTTGNFIQYITQERALEYLGSWTPRRMPVSAIAAVSSTRK